jgi:hypothetical protein
VVTRPHVPGQTMMVVGVYGERGSSSHGGQDEERGPGI